MQCVMFTLNVRGNVAAKEKINFIVMRIFITCTSKVDNGMDPLISIIATNGGKYLAIVNSTVMDDPPLG